MARYEVIVVGAGPAGSATALLLARAGIGTLLIDKAAFPRDKTCGDCLSPRAQRALDVLGLLPAVAQEAHHAPTIAIYAPNGQRATANIHAANGAAGYTLVLPRLRFDHILQEAAIAAGTQFRVERAHGLVRRAGRVLGVQLANENVEAEIVVLATGAATGLLASAGLLPRRPAVSVAARCYLGGFAELEPHLALYLDHVALPGYAWLFPTGAHSANLGLWHSRHRPQLRADWQQLVQHHPRIAPLLRNTHPQGVLKSYPLRSDFLRAPRHAPGVMLVGEAAGLVNPLTGEGIDYALESAQIAAQSILELRQHKLQPSARVLQRYGHRLEQHFGLLFRAMTLGVRLANGPVFNRLFGRSPRGQQLIDALIAVCFGAAPPTSLLRPVLVREALR